MRQSRRMEDVQSPIIPVVGDLIRAQPGTISLGQGVVHYGPPPEAAERVARFLASPDVHKYGPVGGMPELVDALSAKLESENRLRLDAAEVMVTAGGNMAFLNTLLAVADPGDEVILLSPYYFNHEMAVTMAGCRPVVVETDETYQPRLDAIEAALTPRTRAVVSVSPNNPTGAVYPETTLRELNALCRERGVYHIHDEAYEYFVYDDARHFSPGSLPGSETHTLSLFSLSKSYGFASWRIGYMVVPRHLVEAVRKVQDTNLICPPVISQHAALGALEAGAEYCRGKLRGIAEVRRLVLERLAGLGDLCEEPRAEGAFYVFLTLRCGLDPMALVERLIREHGVAVIPGATFGVEDRCCLRVSYGSLEAATVAEGIGRLVEGLRAILGGER